ncbi:MAG: ATP-dependent DNA ligase, partial [Gemmataceae bacterium]
WAVFFLSGRKLPRWVSSRQLASWACDRAGVDPWLFEECYHAVGDLAETITLLLPPPGNLDAPRLHDLVERMILPLADASEQTRHEHLRGLWDRLEGTQRFVLHKMITGAFRVGVSHQLLVRSLAETAGLPPQTISHRLMGNWHPCGEWFGSLLRESSVSEDLSRPYPFFLASPIEGAVETLGQPEEWQAEWKWDGIRAQLIHREGKVFLWSRGEELVTERYPELDTWSKRLPNGTVLDGELLPWKDGRPLPFARLQRRIGRTRLTPKWLQDVPVVLVAYDLLEQHGEDLRPLPLHVRRDRLEGMIASFGPDSRILLSPLLEAKSWDDWRQMREFSRQRLVEGVMLKRRTSPYRVGRVRGDWWKWKISPLSIDAVLVYAQRGSGKRASLFTDYTFALWNEGELVPFAKAYSGLSDAEIREVDTFIRKHGKEKFGPVRSVEPTLVFELAFEGIQPSTRHRSGLAVRFPRILRWRRDKRAEEANSLEEILRMLPTESITDPIETYRQGELFA